MTEDEDIALEEILGFGSWRKWHRIPEFNKKHIIIGASAIVALGIVTALLKRSMKK